MTTFPCITFKGKKKDRLKTFTDFLANLGNPLRLYIEPSEEAKDPKLCKKKKKPLKNHFTQKVYCLF